MTEEITPIYLDHHATTPVDERVVEEMQPYFTETYGNPASDDHDFGAEANRGVEKARARIAEVINARKEEVIFTSGATESDNLAIRGAVEYAKKHGHGNHLITVVTEHEAVLEVCEQLEEEGFEVTYLPVDDEGRVSLADIEAAIREETVLLSIMAANNEIGTITPIEKVGSIAKENQVLFHTDAVQALGYVDLDVDTMNVDLMSLSGHKVYGPKGVGALYIRRRRPKVKLEPLVHGGGHERGWRSGTLNVPGIVGMGKAVQLAGQEREERVSHVRGLRNDMWEQIDAGLNDVTLNGPDFTCDRLPNNLNVSFEGVENKAIVRKLRPNIAVSAGSACTTGSVEASHVLQAISNDESRWHSAIRFGLGKDNTEEEIESTTDQVIQAVGRLRKLTL
ncbi:IscS subfamily cysteine desulfurase [Haladaptatus sp. W1]|uniref:cysteine desulfurase family protein n=1 Tax=Haladaptatus sp. W1 TaxID=1897478 RepID=UPI000849B03A|nr:cysteine desulfurase family protein [Haladaptatus sp. W1]ODR83291.1 IscS subfamily cysteine desulfurase [Haladaptatus sp. W1]